MIACATLSTIGFVSKDNWSPLLINLFWPRNKLPKSIGSVNIHLRDIPVVIRDPSKRQKIGQPGGRKKLVSEDNIKIITAFAIPLFEENDGQRAAKIIYKLTEVETELTKTQAKGFYHNRLLKWEAAMALTMAMVNGDGGNCSAIAAATRRRLQ